MTARQFPSVTSILSVIDKPALAYWRSYAIADWIKETPSARALANGMERDEWRKYVHGVPFAASRKGGKRSAAALGTMVHDLCEQYVLGGQFGFDPEDEAAPFVREFIAWAEREDVTFEAAESTIIGYGLSDPLEGGPHSYAGTLDGLMKWGDRLLIYDITTNRDSHDKDGKPTGPYPEKVLQLAAYRYASLLLPTRVRAATQFRRRWYEITDEELATADHMPEVDGAYVIHLTPVSCRLYPVKADEESFAAFLQLRAFYQFWTEGPSLIGEVER